MKKLIIPAFIFCGCGDNNKTSVQSPFSHLDTVTTKVVETPKEDGTLKSPFSGLDNKK